MSLTKWFYALHFTHLEGILEDFVVEGIDRKDVFFYQVSGLVWLYEFSSPPFHTLVTASSPCWIPLHSTSIGPSLHFPFSSLSSHISSPPPSSDITFCTPSLPGWWWTLYTSSSIARSGASSDPWHPELSLCQALQPREHLHVWTWRRCWKQLGQRVCPGEYIGGNIPP